MYLDYTFNDEDFAFFIDTDELIDALIDEYGATELLKEWHEKYYDKLPNSEKETLSEYGMTSDVNSIDNIDYNDQQELVRYEDCIDMPYHMSELYDWFEDEAYDSYQDIVAGEDDPYSYIGMSRSDFV